MGYNLIIASSEDSLDDILRLRKHITGPVKVAYEIPTLDELTEVSAVFIFNRPEVPEIPRIDRMYWVENKPYFIDTPFEHLTCYVGRPGTYLPMWLWGRVRKTLPDKTKYGLLYEGEACDRRKHFLCCDNYSSVSVGCDSVAPRNDCVEYYYCGLAKVALIIPNELAIPYPKELLYNWQRGLLTLVDAETWPTFGTLYPGLHTLMVHNPEEVQFYIETSDKFKQSMVNYQYEHLKRLNDKRKLKI